MTCQIIPTFGYEHHCNCCIFSYLNDTNDQTRITEMNRSELLQKISNDTMISKKEADRVLDIIKFAVINSLRKGNKVTLVGFGTFSTLKKAERIARNPKTKQLIKVESYSVPKFKAGKAFIDAIDE